MVLNFQLWLLVVNIVPKPYWSSLDSAFCGTFSVANWTNLQPSARPDIHSRIHKILTSAGAKYAHSWCELAGVNALACMPHSWCEV